MTTYRAVVKHPLDASQEEIIKALKEGLEMIAAELVGEHGLSIEEVETVLDEARNFAEIEYEYNKNRD